jgi:HPt (histidine-containing phosphotransfer) domain-containing protein
VNGAGAAPRPLRLKRGPAKADISDAVLATAEAIVDRLSVEYPVHASRDLEQLEQAAALLAGDEQARDSHFGDIFRIAHDIRGQGAVFGHPLMSRLAGSLCLAMRALEPQDGAMTTIIQTHIAGMQALLEHGVTGAGNRPALTIAAGLELMVRSRTGR